MENKSQNVFDSLEAISQQVENLSIKIDALAPYINKEKTKDKHEEDYDQAKKVHQTKETDRELFSKFIRLSKKEYIWFGSKNDFIKSKIIYLTFFVLFFIVGIISTILTSMVFKMYSTFTLFENIWLIIIFAFSMKVIGLSKRLTDIDLANRSSTIYRKDSDGILRDTFKVKKRFKIFRIISIISVIGNVVVIFSESTSTLAINAAIFEFLFGIITIILFFIENNLFCMYGNIIVISERNPKNNNPLVLVFDVFRKKLISFDECKKIYGDYIN